MSEENKTEKEEEVVVDEKVLDSAIEEGEKADDGISQGALDAADAFDRKIDGEEDDSTDDDTSEEEGVATEEGDSGDDEEKLVEKTAEDKAIEEAVKAIESEDSTEEEKEEEKTEEAEKEKYISDLDPEEWDEDAIKADTERGQKHLDETNELKAQNGRLEEALQQQANTEYTNWFDRKIAALGDDFHETLGVGDFEDIEPGSPEMENRAKLSEKMNILAKAYEKAGKPVPQRSKLFEKAVSYEFNEIKNKSKTEKATIKKLAKRASQTIGKGSTKSSAISAQKAIQANKDFDAKIDD